MGAKPHPTTTKTLLVGQSMIGDHQVAGERKLIKIHANLSIQTDDRQEVAQEAFGT